MDNNEVTYVGVTSGGDNRGNRVDGARGLQYDCNRGVWVNCESMGILEVL